MAANGAGAAVALRHSAHSLAEALGLPSPTAQQAAVRTLTRPAARSASAASRAVTGVIPSAYRRAVPLAPH